MVWIVRKETENNDYIETRKNTTIQFLKDISELEREEIGSTTITFNVLF